MDLPKLAQFVDAPICSEPRALSLAHLLRMPSISESWSEYCQTCNAQELTFTSIIEGGLFCSPPCATAAAEICAELERALESDDLDSHFRDLGETSQITLNVMRKILETPSAQVHRHKIRRVIMRLSLQYSILPASLFLEGVQCPLRETYACGGFADIYRGTYNHEQVVLKKLRVFQSIEESKRNILEKDFLRESIMWKDLKHEHVLDFLGVDASVFKETLCMVLPWMPNGNIRSFIQSRKDDSAVAPEMFQKQVHIWLYQIAQGLAYLHDERVVHGDLRGANILVDSEFKVRLADFGLAVFAEGASNANMSKREGNVRWLAPELISPETFGSKSSRPTYESDIYSYGMVCVELYLGQRPLESYSDAYLLSRVVGGFRPRRPHLLVGDIPMLDSLWRVANWSWENLSYDRPKASQVAEALAAVCAAEATPFGDSAMRISHSRFVCDRLGCDASFPTETLQVEHRRMHPHLSGFTCATCEAVLTSLSGFKRHLTLRPECADGDHVVRRQRWDEACDLYEQGFHTTAMQLFSCIQGQSITFINRGIIFANLGMHTEALADYETGIEMGHNSIVCDFLRGISCYALGDFRVAIQWFDKVVERLDIIGCAGINYEPIGMDYAVYALKAHFNKAACLDVLGEDGSTQMLQNAAKDIQDAELPDERLHSDLIYSLPDGVCFRPPDARYWDV